MVFWKGNICSDGVDNYLRFILVDEEVSVDIYFIIINNYVSLY